jgi:hypothetical protein
MRRGELVSGALTSSWLLALTSRGRHSWRTIPRIDLARARRLVASGRVGRRNSRLTTLALDHAGELTHRPRGDQLDRDAIRAQCLRQPLGISTVPEQD